MYYIIKVLISAILIVGISELSKRSSLIGQELEEERAAIADMLK